MIYQVINPHTGEEFFFASFPLVEQSIGITYSRVANKPSIHRTKVHEWCVGDIDSPELIIVGLPEGEILNEATHL